MGQLAVKLKQFVEKIDWSSDRAKHGALSTGGSDLLCGDKQTSTDDLPSNVMRSKDNELLQQVFGKLELIETVVENQRQTIDDHDVKLRAVEYTLRKIAVQTNAKSQEEGCEIADPEGEKESTLGRLFESIFLDKTKPDAEQTETNPRQLLQQHSEALRKQEDKLTTTITRVETIQEMVDEKGFYGRVSELQETLKGFKKTVETLRKNHDLFKNESEEQLQLHRKLLDNLFSGFVVAFVIVVFICMFSK